MKLRAGFDGFYRARTAVIAAATGVAVAAGILAGSIVEPAAAQAAKTVLDGVYSDAQATRGKKLYVDSCSSCHQEGLQGADLAPALKGEDFILKWAGSSMQDLFTKIVTTMPADAPATSCTSRTATVFSPGGSVPTTAPKNSAAP